MFIEKRKQGKKTKYYLIHSYRLGKKTKRISRYLGSNLSEKELKRLKARAKQIIIEQIKEHILSFELTKEELDTYKKFDRKIKIRHLQKLDWNQFTEEFTYDTNAIEGSTVEYDDVHDLLTKKEKPESDDEKETINVAKAVEYIRNTKEELSLALIKKLHLICFKGTKGFAGKIRDVEVGVRDGMGNIIHRGAPAKDVEELLQELVSWYSKHKKKYPPLLLSALVHDQFETIHPFQDGNGRVGRLLLNYVLLKHGYPPINIRLKDRTRYYESLQAFQRKGDIKPTLRFLISEYKKQYK